MKDTTRQSAEGKVLMHFSMSLDGFVAGPGHSMDWMREDATNRPGLLEEYVETTGAVLGGRAGSSRSSHPRSADSSSSGAWSTSSTCTSRRCCSVTASGSSTTPAARPSG